MVTRNVSSIALFAAIIGIGSCLYALPSNATEPLGNSTCDGGTGTVTQDTFLQYVNDTTRNGFSLDGGSTLADGGALLSPAQQAMVCSQINAYGTYMASDGGSTGAGWQTAYSVNFPSLASLNLMTAGDVAQSIGDGKGAIWTPVGSALSTTNQIQIVNGTGLVIQSTATSSVIADARLWAILGNLTAGYYPLSNDMELWFHFSAANFTQSWEWASVGIVKISSPPAVDGNFFASSGYRAGTGGSTTYPFLWSLGNAPTSTTVWDTVQDPITDNVVVLRLSGSPVQSVTIWSGAWSSTWPSFDSLRFQGILSLYTSGTGGASSGFAAQAVPPSQLAVMFTAENTNSGSNAKLTLIDFRVLAR